MKNLLLLLAFLNVVYFFWEMTASTTQVMPRQQVPLYAESKLEKLTFVSKEEVTQQLARKRVLEGSVTPVSAGLKNECYLVGDFAKKSDASRLATGLSAVEGRASVVSHKVFKEFWVVFPSSGDWVQSLANVKELKSKGVVDLWLVPNGGNKGVVSLGLYKTADSSEKRLKELKNKGVSAEIIRNEKSRYSVKVEINGGIRLIQDYLNRSQGGSESGIRKTSC
ncbi:MAG: hypothetical protein JKX87_03370 [Cycloclasticus sp.]|nr:hypothetical protein [Cycloclasticus sp.]